MSKGTMIAVPELEATRPGRTTDPLREAAAKAAQARAAAALEQLAAPLDADNDRAVAELKATDALISGMNQAHIPRLIRRISYSFKARCCFRATWTAQTARSSQATWLGSLCLGIHLGSITDGVAVRS